MNEQIKIFESPQFGKIRTAGTPDEPMFCAADVCRALQYVNSRDALAKHVDEDDVAKRDTIDRLGRKQSMAYVNESGLYALIFGSKLKTAKDFKRWVTSVVLPTIRKTGGYMISKPQMPTFDQLPTAVYELQTKVDYPISLVEQSRNVHQRAVGKSELILGRFKPGEQIQMSDKRLYDGNGSPFRNYQQMARAKRKGCPFRTPDNMRQWSINAEDLRDWLTSNKPTKIFV